mgnify:CR=1 FL=1
MPAHTFEPLEISRILIEWFEKNGRHLPWRPQEDPYRIWLMVVMLQQTRVETVLPYYERFIERFPNLSDLAQASDEDVLAVWKGLGYYSRAQNLVAAAREMQATYGGRVPQSPQELMQLPGIGEYTAAAIASIAYEQAEVAVDGNVLRFLARFFGETGDITKPQVRARLIQHARLLLPAANRGLHNQAVMDFGALVCAPIAHCEECPVRFYCTAFSLGIQQKLPIKGKKNVPVEEHLHVALISDTAGRTLLLKRPEQGLLARFWELPNVPMRSVDVAADFASAELRVAHIQKIGEMRHVFSHRIWQMSIVRAHLVAPLPANRVYRWVENPLEHTLPRAFSKILETYKKS